MWNFLWSPSWIGWCLTNNSRPVCIVIIPFCLVYDINTAMYKCNCLPFRSTWVDFRFWLGQNCLPLVLCGCLRWLFHYCSFICYTTIWFPCSQSFKLFGFSIFRLWTYMMIVNTETNARTTIRYLRFDCHFCLLSL